MSDLQARTCRACDAEIIFAGTVNGKAIPVDVSPDPNGNVRLTNRRGLALAEVLGPLDVEIARVEGEALHLSHFATCPHPERFRR